MNFLSRSSAITILVALVLAALVSVDSSSAAAVVGDVDAGSRHHRRGVRADDDDDVPPSAPPPSSSSPSHVVDPSSSLVLKNHPATPFVRAYLAETVRKAVASMPPELHEMLFSADDDAEASGLLPKIRGNKEKVAQALARTRHKGGTHKPTVIISHAWMSLF